MQEGVIVALGEADGVGIDIKHDITTHGNRIAIDFDGSTISCDLPGGTGIERGKRTI